jgi:anti-sigma28 factor (negative regulator of flagellin synthesis)
MYVKETAPATRYGHRGAVGGCGKEAAVFQPAGTPMTDSRTNTVNTISDRISKSHYEVDSSAVAAAILERLLAGNIIPNELNR